MQETHVLSLIQEDDTDAMEQLSPCDTTTESALEPGRYNYWSPCALEPVLRNKRRHHNEKTMHGDQRVTTTGQSSHSMEGPA